MSLLLYINGQLADLEPGQAIARTLQVNDLNSLDDRQASYTNKFKLPKTAANLRIMQFLSVPGNTSNIPYQKNECSLYSDSGECFVYKGQAVITDSGNDFEVVVYDGIINLYKEIENKTFFDVGLQELDHVKSIQAVKDSWQNDYNYRYILADYNGKTGNTANGTVNIDYLVPSVKVSYLWDKVFRSFADGGFGEGYTGSVFETEDFLNLWMTFPKGITSAESETEVFLSNNYVFPSAVTDITEYPKLNRCYAKFNSFENSSLSQTPQNIHYTVTEAGKYKLELSGTIQAFYRVFKHNQYPDYDPTDEDGWILKYSSFPAQTNIFVSKNAQGTNILQAQPDGTIYTGLPFNSSFEKTILLDLEAMESFCIIVAPYYQQSDRTFFIDSSDSSLSVKISKINQSAVSFGEILKDFPIRDFLTEVVQRFGLTMFKDKYSNRYDFLTLQEHLQTDDVVNWSDKFIAKTGEKYSIGSYGQRSWFRYKYNDKEASHYDHYIEIANPNLPDTKDVIKSNIYAPEKPDNRTRYLGLASNVYKLWEKELVENPAEGEEPFTYKALDKRFYFLRAEPRTTFIKLVSDELQEYEPLLPRTYYREVYRKLSFSDIIRAYYRPQLQILERPVMITAEMWLTAPDMAAFDFRKLYYIEQLGSYFIVNKIINYVPGRPVKCELVKVDYGNRPQPLPNTQITNITVQEDNKLLIEFDINVYQPYMLLMAAGTSAFSPYIINPQSPYETPALAPGTYQFVILCGGQFSNIFPVVIE